MMLPVTSIDLTIFFISVQIISGYYEFVSKNYSLKSYNTTNPAKSWRFGRSKRSIYDKMPLFLQMMIQYEGGPTIATAAIKQEPTLANKYLPVISNQVDLFRNVMNDVGEFVTYNDVQNCIALVYFQKLETVNGVVGLNHHIANLPFNFNKDGNYLLGLVKTPYVNENHHQFLHINPQENYPSPSDIDAWEEFLRPTGCTPNELKQQYACEPQPSTSRQFSEQNIRKYLGGARHFSIKKPIPLGSSDLRQYYVETLVLVTRDFADIFREKFGEEYIIAIVRYHIIYFNAVNMLLKKLGKMQFEHYEVTINMAKIVIEDDSISFGFETGDGLQFSDITTKLPFFLSNHQDHYKQEILDYVFVHTSHSIMDGNIMVDAISKYGQDMIKGRQTGTFYETIPITVVKLKTFYAHYGVAAHEIGRTWGLKITPKEDGIKPTGQCSSIMQRYGPKCNTCLSWTVQNHYEFLTFFSKNRNRCFLLNYPHSLHPPVVHRSVSPNKQCQCLGYESYIKLPYKKPQSDVRVGGCSELLSCQNVRGYQIIREYTMLPFEGTPCSRNKVCWNQICQEIGSIPIKMNQE